MFAFPSNINIDYKAQNYFPAKGGLIVGSAIKDMEEGSATAMRVAHDEKVESVRRQFESDTKEYQRKFEAATGAAAVAAKEIKHARRNKLLSITALALTVVGAVGLLIGAAATGIAPLAFAALPLIGLLVPESYLTHVYRKAVSKLEKLMAAPGNMAKPRLILPVYHSREDLELRQSRIDAQNALSQMTLSKLATSGYSSENIVKYALLDRASNVGPEARPEFYSRCLQLIASYGTVIREHNEHQRAIARETNRLNGELERWAKVQTDTLRMQKRDLNRRRENLRRQDYDRERGLLVPMNHMEKFRLNADRQNHKRQKAEFRQAHQRSANQISDWSLKISSRDNRSFNQLMSTLEGQYTAAKQGR